MNGEYIAGASIAAVVYLAVAICILFFLHGMLGEYKRAFRNATMTMGALFWPIPVVVFFLWMLGWGIWWGCEEIANLYKED